MSETLRINKKNFIAADHLVEIITTTTPRRWPPHNFPVVVLRLRPAKGTRVLPLANGGVEYMPRYSEILALCLQLGLVVAAVPSDKPENRRIKYARINARRHARRSL